MSFVSTGFMETGGGGGGGEGKLPKFVSPYDIWRTTCFWDSMYISLIFLQCLEFGFQIFSKLLNAKQFQCILWRRMGRFGIDPLILNFERRWWRVVQLKLWLLYYNTYWIESWVGSRAGLEVDEGNLSPCHYSAVVQHVASSLYWSRYSDPHFKDHYYTG
jgi:hypothetical protein